MRVLVTRPGEDAGDTERLLVARGHQVLRAPLLRVYFRDLSRESLDGVQGILLTSANGARAIIESRWRRNIPIFAVGRKTAEVAREYGFSTVRSADGDVEALAQAVSQWANPANGRLVHAASAHADGRLRTLLMSRGFKVSQTIVYDVAVAPSELLVRSLSEWHPDAALFFSSRSALAFCEFVAVHGLKDTTRSIIAAAISPATAESLKSLEFREIRIAAAPNQDALLALLG